MRLDLIDEFRLDLHRLDNNRLDLVSSTEFSNGTVGLHYRRHR